MKSNGEHGDGGCLHHSSHFQTIKTPSISLCHEAEMSCAMKRSAGADGVIPDPMNSSTEASGIIPATGDMDVICGRGKKSKDHKGNARFHAVIRRYKDSYRDASTKDEKTRISLSVLQELRPSRFLKQTVDGKWIDIGDSAAREKISQALREAINQRPPQVRPKKVPRKLDEMKIQSLLAAQREAYLRLCRMEGLEPADSDSSIDSSIDDLDHCEPALKKQRSFDSDEEFPTRTERHFKYSYTM